VFKDGTLAKERILCGAVEKKDLVVGEEEKPL
jgi:hypothetical protein